MNRAYRTTWNSITSIVPAESPSQAKHRTQASACEAGYKAEWCDIRVRRAPEHDGWAAKRKQWHCVDESFINFTKQESKHDNEENQNQDHEQRQN